MGSWINRRRFRRNEIQVPVAYRRLGGGLCWTRTYDVSAGGVRMRSMEPLRTGTALDIVLYIPAKSGEKVFNSRGTVVWCQPQGTDTTLTCGVMFQDIRLDVLKIL